MNTTLSGLKVVELSTFIAVPACARFFADLGADVIASANILKEIYGEVTE